MASRRPSLDQIKDASKYLITGANLMQNVWDALNHDERLSNTIKDLIDRLGKTRLTKDPVVRLEEQLDLIDASLADLHEQEEAVHDVEDVEKLALWQRQATVLRSKLPLVRAQDVRQRRATLRDLNSRVAMLLAAVIRHGLENEADAEPVAMVEERSNKSVRRSFPWIRKH